MSIYTRTGDKGMTSLFGGKRVLKSDPQVEAYGEIDELTSYLGLVSSKLPTSLKLRGASKTQNSKLFLTKIQEDLYKIMAFLSGAKQDLDFLTNRVKDFESKIDELEKELPKLHRFIIPNGTELSSWFHVLRTVCRRSERCVVRYHEKLEIVRYLNRLSDLFFMFARKYTKGKEVKV